MSILKLALKDLHLRIILVVTAASLYPSLSWSEFLCSANVTYQWKKADQNVEVHWRGLEAKGKDEEEAKQRVLEAANPEKTRALASCTKEHQNLSGCVAAKFEANAYTYNSLGFAARKALEEAINKDCAASQGSCLDSKVSEPKCRELVSAVPSPSATAVAEEKVKGKK